ncbi:hypothetical protein QZH41_009863, partial [Actinostola sp. cb2023]
ATWLAVAVLVVGVVLIITGVVLLATAKRNCESSTSATAAQDKRLCDLSDEAKRSGLATFLDNVKKTYYELHPFNTQYNPDLSRVTNASYIVKSKYTAYDPTPSAIKKRTDAAFTLLKELKALDIVQEKLNGRERKAYSKVQLYLQQVFGKPFEVNYYTGDWMLGPDSFCYSLICYMGYEFDSAMKYHKPDSLKDVELLKAKLMSHKKSLEQYVANMRMGVRKGMVRNIESCKAGIDALKFEHQQISLYNATGVLKEWYAAKLLSPMFYIKITKQMDKEWTKTHKMNVSESVKQYLVEYLGEPLANVFRYLKDEYVRHCVPSNVSSGFATLPLKYVYTDGIANTSWPTDPTLPLTDKVLNGKESYKQIMPYFTTNDMTPDQVYKLGWDMLNELYPKAVQVAREITKVYNDNDTAVAEFRKILNSSSSYFNEEPFPKNESGAAAHRRCNSVEGAKKHCPARWRAIQKWFDEARKAMSLLDPKTINMFYFTGAKHTTPNCPVELKPNLNPSSGAQSYSSSNKACTYSASYYIPFFLERLGPNFSEWSINAHEARPGHHTQVQGRVEHFQSSTCSDSLGWVNQNTYTAFSEGWALYAESPLIAEDTDTYDNEPMQRYGMLQMQIWRAIRLVVDPGLHYKGMTRAEALQLHSDYAWDDTDVAQKEVTRYQSVAGQATGYMIGQLDIKKAREYATRELGSKFDLRDFHYQVLSQGALPLGYLSDHIHRYVACKKEPMKTGCDEILVPPSKTPSTVTSENTHHPVIHPHERHYI